jgi:hypothetical protein
MALVGAPDLAWPRQSFFLMFVCVAYAAANAVLPEHLTIMTAYGYNASAQSTFCTFAKSFNLTELVEGYHATGLKGMYRIDCVGCERLWDKGDGFAGGVICHNKSTDSYHLCSKECGGESMSLCTCTPILRA